MQQPTFHHISANASIQCLYAQVHTILYAGTRANIVISLSTARARLIARSLSGRCSTLHYHLAGPSIYLEQGLALHFLSLPARRQFLCPGDTKSMPPRRRRRWTEKRKPRKPASQTDDWWEVRNIVDERPRGSTVEYLVDWEDDRRTGEPYQPSWVSSSCYHSVFITVSGGLNLLIKTSPNYRYRQLM